MDNWAFLIKRINLPVKKKIELIQDKTIIMIDGGQQHALFVTDYINFDIENHIYGFGKNSSGELGSSKKIQNK